MSSKYTMCTMCEEELVGFRLRAETRMFCEELYELIVHIVCSIIQA